MLNIYIYIQHLSKEGAGYSLFFQMRINSSVFPFALLWQEEIHKLHSPDSLQLDFCLVLPLRGTTGILEGEKKGETTFLRHSGSVTSNGSDSRSDSRCSGSCGWLVQDNQFLIRHMVQQSSLSGIVTLGSESYCFPFCFLHHQGCQLLPQFLFFRHTYVSSVAQAV